MYIFVNLQFIELLDVKLRMLGSHQLQNAVTATCAALCLQSQGENLTKAPSLVVEILAVWHIFASISK